MNLNVSTKGPAAGAIVIEWNVNDGIAYSKLKVALQHSGCLHTQASSPESEARKALT